MLQTLSNKSTTRPKLPEKMRLYAIGDVHGRRDLLDQILDQIQCDAKKKPCIQKILVMLGDYIDRGPDSQGVLDRLVDIQTGQLLNDFQVHFLKGNHEEAMLAFLAQKDSSTWLDFGGRDTLASYGLDPSQAPEILRDKTLKRLPKKHKRLLRSLEFSVKFGDYGFVHAGIRPGISWHNQNPDDLMWIREDFLTSNADFGAIIVHGHTPTKTPVIRNNRIGIDTRAWESGTLTCLVLENTEQRFLNT